MERNLSKILIDEFKEIRIEQILSISHVLSIEDVVINELNFADKIKAYVEILNAIKSSCLNVDETPILTHLINLKKENEDISILKTIESVWSNSSNESFVEKCANLSKQSLPKEIRKMKD